MAYPVFYFVQAFLDLAQVGFEAFAAAIYSTAVNPCFFGGIGLGGSGGMAMAAVAVTGARSAIPVMSAATAAITTVVSATTASAAIMTVVGAFGTLGAFTSRTGLVTLGGNKNQARLPARRDG